MLKEKVLNTIQKYNLIQSGDSLVVGVSGGPDSICLLHILIAIRNDPKNNLDYKIHVAHINHMIRDDADRDVSYVIDFCSKYQIPYFIEKKDVLQLAKKAKIGTEEAGRNLRYSFFDEVLKKTSSNKIVTAHNLNDKVETVLMNILRGAGTYGLKGIEPVRDHKYIRPLIEINREEIEEYCRQENLNPRYDSTNALDIYTRNKVRNKLIPYLASEFNPNILEAIENLSQIIAEDNDYLESIVKKEYEDLILEKKANQIVLDLKKFNLLELVIKRRVILYTIRELLKTTQGIEKIHIEDLIKLCSNNIGNKFLTPNKKIKVLVKKGKVFFMSNNEHP